MVDQHKPVKPSVTDEEKSFRQKLIPDVKEIKNKNLLCTSCGTSVKDLILKGKPISHPFLETLLCNKCNNFYGDGQFSEDEDGCDKYCRWCGQGGTLFLCSKCTAGFCKRCVKRNLPKKAHQDLEDDEWKCYCCNPKPIYELRAQCWAAHQYASKYLNEPKSSGSSKSRSSKRKARDSSSDEDEKKTRKSQKVDEDSDDKKSDLVEERRSRSSSSKHKKSDNKKKEIKSKDRREKRKIEKEESDDDAKSDIVEERPPRSSRHNKDNKDSKKEKSENGEKSKRTSLSLREPKKPTEEEVVGGVKKAVWMVGLKNFEDTLLDLSKITKDVNKKILEYKVKKVNVKCINNDESYDEAEKQIEDMLVKLSETSLKIRDSMKAYSKQWKETVSSEREKSKEKESPKDGDETAPVENGIANDSSEGSKMEVESSKPEDQEAESPTKSEDNNTEEKTPKEDIKDASDSTTVEKSDEKMEVDTKTEAIEEQVTPEPVKENGEGTVKDPSENAEEKLPVSSETCEKQQTDQDTDSKVSESKVSNDTPATDADLPKEDAIQEKS